MPQQIRVLDAWLHQRRLAYSVWGHLTDEHAAAARPAAPVRPVLPAEAIGRLLEQTWMPAYDTDGQPRPGAWVAELSGWPPGTAFATTTRPVRCPGTAPSPAGSLEDRIRGAKDTGLTNLPLHDFAQIQIWCAVVALSLDLVAWTQLLALAGQPVRRWEPKRLRHRLFWLQAGSPSTPRPRCYT